MIINQFFLFLQDTQSPLDMLFSISPISILNAILTIAVIYLIIRLSDALASVLSNRAPRARFFFKMAATIVRFSVLFVGGTLIVAIFAPSQQTLFAVLASAGLALGLGAQDLIKNIIGGLVILIDRPFQLGDLVKIGDAYGEVVHIGLRSTKLITQYDTKVTIPNTDILNGQAWNSNSGVPDCQVVTDIFLPHDVDPVKAVEIAYEAAYSSPYLLLAKPVVVLLQDKLAPQPFVLVRIRAYVYDHRFELEFQTDITVRAKAEYLRQGLINWNKYNLSKNFLESSDDQMNAIS
ncbi:MAG: mechanosensitive ion channel [Blastocatellia bacterium]|nr:mechanosensitive ion channel [Blastocatellia bacterium]